MKKMDRITYLHKLKSICDIIPADLEREIFYLLCKQYQQSLVESGNVSKYVSKQEIVDHLVDVGLLKMTKDKKTGEDKRPDDRGVRSAVRRLMKNGLPILSSSKICGYYICDELQEIEQPYNENKKRALSILSRQKGFEIMQNFINGQIDITEVKLEDEDDYEDEL